MRLLVLLLSLLWALPAAAQDQATLVADRLTLQSSKVMVASGHVEVFYKGQHITASRVVYDAAQDHLVIEGPILITDASGSRITADSAEFTADLTEGLIRTARIVMAEQLQLAAAEMRRDGSVTAMRSVAASSCRVCGDGPPLWEIRARQVVHDAQAQQIWFTGASLRLAGVPVIYLPVLRVPDPTLDRAQGFLFPELSASTALGTGISLPYFIPLGRSRDLTLTPFLTDNGGRTLGWRYRQAYASGTLELAGAFSRDRLLPTDLRGTLRAKAAFDLGGDWHLGFDGTLVSDPAYLQDYGISEEDRLVSTLRLSRVTRDSFTSAELTSLRTLRTTESNATQPSTLTGAEAVRRFTPGALGGTATLYAEISGQRRNATSGADGDGDGIADGRDMGRVSLGAAWARRWVTPGGVTLDAGLQAGADFYSIDQDDLYAGDAARTSARGALRLGYPLIRRDAGGVTLLEPHLQLVTARTRADAAIPNEDSALVEFDEANLYALDRFPGADALETGLRLNLGLSVTRQSDAGPDWGLTLGRVIRLDETRAFSTASGLGGAASDWLVAGQVTLDSRLSLTARALVGEDASLSRFESRFALTGQRAGLSGGYEFVPADATQGRAEDIREVVLDGTARLGDFWTLSASDRYDLSSQTTRASLGLGFRNECLSVDLSVSRRFTSSSIVAPSSDFGLTVELLGLGGASKGRAATTCRR
ncbi:LPS-assembly protein LptD [Stagnihabitans tardus]|uniref:LPS-assembly protein LptD n=1 Tax=Stagnihabitans tardus TaxID=2699202 RepID=A0AAE4YCK2_9RHOB|nr:LPS assembly protein LptD [Stagnihabitans tardus]NBZ87475.1 LPS assembly protein LptD [Stagnihabitans tardus]